MSKQKPRIALTVDEDLNSLLDEISVLTKTPKSTFITGFLVDAKPLLSDLRDALKLAQDKKDYMPTLLKITASTNARAAELNSDMSEFMNKQIDWVEVNDD